MEDMITFDHAETNAGDRAQDIPAYLRIPKGNKPVQGWSLMLFICGLDAYRTDHTNRTDMHIKAGFAIFSFEIPGGGNCPAARNDPASPDRLHRSIVIWVETEGASRYGFDIREIVARGVSTGGHYAFRIARTHADRLLAFVGQGGWSHHALSPEWIRAMNHMEYPFDLVGAIAHKFGYKSYDEFIADRPMDRFSLESRKVLDMPSCRLLILNGLEDSMFPIENSILVASKGRVKDVRFMHNKGHMGNPGGEQIIIDWINEVVAGRETAAEPKTSSA